MYIILSPILNNLTWMISVLFLSHITNRIVNSLVSLMSVVLYVDIDFLSAHKVATCEEKGLSSPRYSNLRLRFGCSRRQFDFERKHYVYQIYFIPNVKAIYKGKLCGAVKREVILWYTQMVDHNQGSELLRY